MTVVLYGATGFTGRLVTRELRRRGFDFVLPGRTRSVSSASAFDPEVLLNHCGGHGLSWELDTATAAV